MATAEQAQLIVVRGVIAGLDKPMQEEIAMVAAELRATMNKYGDTGIMALALLGAEVAAEAS